jgi:hypothetical protein
MKIVRNPNRWLKKLSQAAALVSLMAGSQTAYSQDGGFTFGRTPTGSASEVVDSNTNGLGVTFRGGHMAGSTVGREESITHINLMPYVSINDGMLFGDSRLLRANKGDLGWSFGGGYRHYIQDWDVVVGGNGYYDHDGLTGADLQQWSAGAEILAHGWEMRGNYYQTFGDTFSLVGQRIDQNSAAFAGNNITFTRIDTFAEALKGFDAEAGILLPGDIAERFDLRAFGGGYFYEGENIDGFAGWSTRLQADIGRWLELGLKLTDDEVFSTTLSFNAAVYFGGFESQEHTKRSAIQRFRDPVRRNMNVVASTSDTLAPGQIAIDPNDNLPFTVAHVNSNDLIGPFNGTVENPFANLTQGLGANTDIVFVHAGSQFNAAPQNVVSLLPSQKLIGEGLIQTNRSTETSVTVLALGNPLQLTLPDSPTFAANPNLLRPTIGNSVGNAVTMANDSAFSGFIIDNPTGNGIFSNGAVDTSISDVLVQGAGQSAIFLQNTSGTTAITNTTLIADAAATGATFHVNGGSGTVRFSSTDNFVLAAITNASSQQSVLIENMTGGNVDMIRSSVTEDGGLGVVIRNNTGGAATLDNLNLANSSGTGIAILDSAGNYTIRKTSTQLQQTTVTNAALQSILVNNASGTITFTDDVLISSRNAEGVEVRFSSGDVTFNDNVTLNDLAAGAVARAGVFVHDQLANGSVAFQDQLTIRGTATRGSLAEGVFLTNNNAASEFLVSGDTNIVGTNGVSVRIDNNNGLARFLGQTQISQRLVEGIAVTNSAGAVQFGGTAGDVATVLNDLAAPSQSAAILATNNSANIVFGGVSVDNAQGNLPGGAGMHLVNNTGEINVGTLNIVSLDGVGLFGLNNSSIEIRGGDIISDNQAAVNIEQSGIEISLESVTSSNSPNYGIRLVETNRTNLQTFEVDPNIANDVPGDGGIISGAKGNGLDDNDAAGVFLQNAGQVRLRAMTLDDNEFGVRIRNTETTPGLPDSIKQNFILERSLVQESDIRGLDSQDLMGLSIQNSTFDNNGDDAGDGRETILLNYTTRLDLDTITRFSQANDPFVVTIEDSDFTSVTNDVIRVGQTGIGANGAAIRFDLLRNSFTVSDTADFTGAGGADLLDDAFIFDWDGPAQVIVEDNLFDMISVNQQQAVRIITDSNTDELDFSFQRNQVNVNNVTLNEGAVDLDLTGPANINSANYQIANNVLNLSDGTGVNNNNAGGLPTGFELTLNRVADVGFVNNDIIIAADGGTGIHIDRAVASSEFLINGNRIGFFDNGNAAERGIIFRQVTGVVSLFGNVDNEVIILQNNGGNGVVEQAFLMPLNSNNGRIIVNGALVP